jgi:glycosyltransferase involved in cell wall biosynthesis
LEIPPGIKVFRTKTFEFYNLYKFISRKKEIPYGGFANAGKTSLMQKLSKAVRGNLFLPDPRRGWNRYAFKKAADLIRKYDIRTVVTTSPPHSTQLIGLKLKRKFPIRWIADLRDPWTDIYYYKELYHSPWAARLDRRMELKVLEEADHLITVSEDLKRIFAGKLAAGASSKISVLPNGYDESDFSQCVEPAGDRFIITYTGTISEAYDVSGFLEALARLDRSKRQGMLLRFVGKIPESVVERFRQKLPDLEIELTGYVDHHQSIRYLLQSSVQLLVIPRVENNKGIVTGKFFEYLASGRPVLAIGPAGGDLENLIGETGCGQLFDYDEKDRMLTYLDFLTELKADTGKNPKIRNYSRKVLTGKLVRLLNL